MSIVLIVSDGIQRVQRVMLFNACNARSATSRAPPTAAAALIVGVISSSSDVISSRVLAGERGCWRLFDQSLQEGYHEKG